MIALIVAMAENGVIGRQNTLPWHLSEDLRNFKKLTLGHTVVMGRRTFESIGKPLPGRENIVLSSQSDYQAQGVSVIADLRAWLQTKSKDADIFIIGGASLYQSAYDLADKIYLTLIEKKFEGDVFFPRLDWKNNFRVIRDSGLCFSEKEKLPHRFIEAERYPPPSKFESYNQTHQHPVNRALHTAGIPLILISLPWFFWEWRWALALFVLGWILQFVGHAFEGKAPAFFKNPLFLLTGILWWFKKIFK